jgi:signal transduction histidine kinase
LGYFFSERKYDLGSMATSKEIESYFVNKAMGMSQQYGLKVSLFVIQKLLEKTLREKIVEGDGIYGRFLLTDHKGKVLVDSGNAREGGTPRIFFDPDRLKSPEPAMVYEQAKGEIHILVMAPCFLGSRLSGFLISWLQMTTIFDHFVDSPSSISSKGSALAYKGERLVCPPRDTECVSFQKRFRDLMVQSQKGGIFNLAVAMGNGTPEEFLLNGVPISRTPLSLISWVKKEAIEGNVTPSEMLMVAGSLAFVILVGAGLIFRYNTLNLLLTARFEQAEKQQRLLAEKNQQLKDEIHRRQEAEKELGSQRTLRMHSDRLRSLGEMAAGIAHELNQPLVGVRGLSELLLLQMESEKTPPREDMGRKIELIVQQADRMVHIIDHVRMFAREAGNVETSLVDLNHVVHSGLDLLRTQLRSQGLTLEERLCSECLSVDVNPFSVEEVIVNLVTNARDALADRKGKDGESYTPRIEVSTWREHGTLSKWAILQISDNGTGMAPETAGKVFDPFYTTKAPDKGTGLGLSIGLSIVEGFGGTISFKTKEGEGTRFKVAFPCVLQRNESHNEPSDNV